MNDEKQISGMGKSENPAELKRRELMQVIPEVFGEGRVDVEALKRAIGEEFVVEGGERYRLDWVGKSEAYKVLQTPTTATLRPRRDQSVNFDTANHVFIEGENLETLKVLQKSYFGKVKLIYIDPPYNTGNDHFVYPDRFQESKEEYLKRLNELDDDGSLMREGFFRKNSRESGHYHSNWLSMMLPRLYIARNLLHEEGVIFVSCDDNEVHNLRCLMNEIFGEENFVSQIVVQSNRRGQTYKDISKTHEYILVYSRTDNFLLNELAKPHGALPFEDKAGRFDLWELRNRNPKFGRHNRPNLYFPIYVDSNSADHNELFEVSLARSERFSEEVLPTDSKGRESCWRWSKRKITSDGLSTNPPTVVGRKKNDGSWGIFERSRKATTKPKSIWTETEVISEQGTVELGRYGLSGYFDHPKPVGLVKKVVQIAAADGDLIVDFFAGSGTTLEAVLRQNAEDGGQRQCVLVQLPELLDADNVEFSDIAQVARTRIRAALDDIRQSEGLVNKLSEGEGFRAYSLAPSNFKQWQGDEFESGEELADQIRLFMESEKEGTEGESVLHELLLKFGYELTTRVETLTVAKNPVYSVNDGEVLMVLDALDEAMIQPLVERKPQQLIALDSVFQDSDQLKSNLALQCRDAGIRLSSF